MTCISLRRKQIWKRKKNKTVLTPLHDSHGRCIIRWKKKRKKRESNNEFLINSWKLLFHLNNYVSVLVSWDREYSGSTKSIHGTIPVGKRLYSISGKTWIISPHTCSTFQPVSLPDLIHQEIQHTYPYNPSGREHKPNT